MVVVHAHAGNAATHLARSAYYHAHICESDADPAGMPDLHATAADGHPAAHGDGYAGDTDGHAHGHPACAVIRDTHAARGNTIEYTATDNTISDTDGWYFPTPAAYHGYANSDTDAAARGNAFTYFAARGNSSRSRGHTANVATDGGMGRG